MAIAWNGADPVEVADGEDYELGTAWRADGDLTVTHARIWSGAGEENPAARRFRVWSAVGGSLLVQEIAADLTPGWADVELDTPLEVTSGTIFVTSFNTGGNYGALTGAFDADVVSADGLVTGLSAANSPGGTNGRFNETPGSFPALGAGSHPFYGVTFRYDAGIGGNTAPEITQLAAIPDGATVTTTVVATDAETLVGATARFTWGDGSADTLTTYPTFSAAHTYAVGGIYAQMVRVTDASGASDTAAVAVQVEVASDDVERVGMRAIRNALVSHAKRLGGIDTATGAEPEEGPTQGQVHYAVWYDRISPAPGASGLDATAVRLAYVGRLYVALGARRLEDAELRIGEAVDRLLAAYSGDFTLGGLVRNVDLQGAHGAPLEVAFGYQRIGDAQFRVATFTLPLIVNNVWEQVA